MDAVRLNDSLMVKSLIGKTKAINQVDSSGKTALDYAKELKSKELIALLVQHGAKTANDVTVTLKF
jgi:ankyrin repeat protein